MKLEQLYELQNNLSKRKHFTEFYFKEISEHLWSLFTNNYHCNLLSFYNYLDSKNREAFRLMVMSEFQIDLTL